MLTTDFAATKHKWGQCKDKVGGKKYKVDGKWVVRWWELMLKSTVEFLKR